MPGTDTIRTNRTRSGVLLQKSLVAATILALGVTGFAAGAGAATPNNNPSFNYPSVAPVGSLATASGDGTRTLPFSPQNVGDVLVLVVKVSGAEGAEITANGISGGGVSGPWTLTNVPDFRYGGASLGIWEGTVTTAGPSPINVNFGGVDMTSVYTGLAAQEFSSSFGSNTKWSIDGFSALSNASSATVTFPSETPKGSDELYFGYAAVTSPGSAGATPGFSYATTSDGDVVSYNTDVSSAVQPSATQGLAGVSGAVSSFIVASTTTLPMVTGVTPNSGSYGGGTTVTITGTNFTRASAVSIDWSEAYSFVVNSDTQITAITDEGNLTTGDVTVTTPAGTSARNAPADLFTYFVPPDPTVTSLSTQAGPTAGGTSVTITGTNFDQVDEVLFGTESSLYTVNSPTSITATVPPEAVGTVDITVGVYHQRVSAINAPADQFSYFAPPTVTGVSPSWGRSPGGNSLTLSGTNFVGATAVMFGSTAAAFTVNSNSSITATDPTGTEGRVDVTVTTPGGSSATNSSDWFTYFSPPTVTNVAPTAGPTAGGTWVTISGTNFTGATQVEFGQMAAAAFTVNNNGSISASSPAGSPGTVDVTVTTPGGTSSSNPNEEFSYFAIPQVTSISPGSGPISGGTSVTITGQNLSGATVVDFGTEAAPSFTVNSGTSITARAPAEGVSTVEIAVFTPGGSSATSAAEAFRFQSTGYWMVGRDGSVYAFGGAPNQGSLPGLGVRADDIVALVPTADSRGYWMIGSDGGVFAFGDAGFVGSLPALGVHVRDIVAVVPTATGDGYWMIGSDGGVFAFGDAGFTGSVPGLGIHVDDIVGAVPTADGTGYWMIGSDGGVFAFGGAGFVGSLPGMGIHVHDVVGVVATHDGRGYWMVGNDGGVFAFGDAGFTGSVPSLGVHVTDIVGFARQ